MFQLDDKWDFFTHGLPNFKKHLMHFAGKSCHFVEVGSLEGRCAIWLLQNILTHPDSTLTCIDNGGAGRMPQLYHNMGYFPGKVRILEATSVHALCLLLHERRLFEFIYIDGMHETYMPLYDLVLAHEILHVNGIIGVDDYLFRDSERYGKSNVRQCFDAFIKVYEGCYERLDNYPMGPYQQWIKKLRFVPNVN